VLASSSLPPPAPSDRAPPLPSSPPRFVPPVVVHRVGSEDWLPDRVDRRRCRSHQVPLDLLRRKLGPNAWELYRRLLRGRNRKTWECWEGVMALRELGFGLPRLNLKQYGRAMTRLGRAGLVDPAREWNERQIGDAYVPVPVRVVWGFVAFVEVSVPWRTVQWLKQAGRGGRRPGAGRPRKGEIKGGSRRPDRAGSGPPVEIKGGSNLIATSLSDRKGSTSLTSVREGPSASRAARAPQTTPKTKAETSFPTWHPPVLAATAGNSSPTVTRGSSAGSAGGGAGCAPTGGEGPPRDPRLGFSLGGDVRAAGGPRGCRSMMPPYPGVEVIRPATVPPPPVIPDEAPDLRAATMCAEAYWGELRSTYEGQYGRRGDVARSKHFAALTAAGRFLREEGVSPAVWVQWSIRCWAQTAAGERKPPTMAWVFSARRMESKWEWFLHECGSNDSRWHLPIGGTHRKLLNRWCSLAVAVRGRTLDEAARLVAHFFPGDTYNEMVAEARAEVEQQQMMLDEDVRRGRWIW